MNAFLFAPETNTEESGEEAQQFIREDEVGVEIRDHRSNMDNELNR
jgi:hypothetical protein